MQDVNNQPLLRGKISSLAEHESSLKNAEHYEFILFGDNLLECFTLLNPAIEEFEIWDFQYVVYEPIDQPIYVFKTQKGRIISIKACGVYSNWPLPEKVSDLIYRYDLPDFVLYNVTEDKIVLAGEFTETASVGNSQWQRELRKIAAGELGIPFIYQTVYSGKDDSRNTIREPTSLLPYNAFLYSIRYRVSSLVFFIEPNIEASRTRERSDSLSPSLIAKLFAAYVLNEIGEQESLHREIEARIFKSMADYMKETKYSSLTKSKQTPRLIKDIPCVDSKVKNSLLTETEEFVEILSEYLHNPESEIENFLNNHDFSNLDVNLMKNWTDKQNTIYIKEFFDFLEEKSLKPAVAPLAKFAAGIVASKTVVQFLKDRKFKVEQSTFDKILDFEETAIIPIYFHKTSDGKLQFTKDPYAGNTAAFAELFGFDSVGNKKRSILTYCVSTNPDAFDLHTKRDTNIYRSVAKYSDVLIMDTGEVIDMFQQPTKSYKKYKIGTISELVPLSTTEDMAVVSTYLQMAVIGSDWDVCMIAIHHSSWQQIRIRDNSNYLDTAKIGRNDSKVDLVMQSPDNLFYIAEGKKKYTDFFSSKAERDKIEAAFDNTRILIDDLYKSNLVEKIISFICLLDIPEVNTEFFLAAERKKIIDSISAGHLDNLANHHFLVIGTYTLSGKTFFELFFSKDFPDTLLIRLKEIFK